MPVGDDFVREAPYLSALPAGPYGDPPLGVFLLHQYLASTGDTPRERFSTAPPRLVVWPD